MVLVIGDARLVYQFFFCFNLIITNHSTRLNHHHHHDVDVGLIGCGCHGIKKEKDDSFQFNFELKRQEIFAGHFFSRVHFISFIYSIFK